VVPPAAVYVVLWRDAPTLVRAFRPAFEPWILALLLFFPVAGRSFPGLVVTPGLIVASAVPHLLFATLLRGPCRLRLDPRQGGSPEREG
jgi:hypothetical protein